MPVRLMRRHLAALPQGALARCKRGAAQSAEQSAYAVVVPKDVTALGALGLVALRLQALLPRLPEQVPPLQLPLAVQRVSQSFAALQPELELKELPSRLLARQPELLPWPALPFQRPVLLVSLLLLPAWEPQHRPWLELPKKAEAPLWLSPEFRLVS